MEDQCRICLLNSGRTELHIGSTPLSLRISICAGYQIEPNDGSPTRICDECLAELEVADRFRKKCEASSAKLRRLMRSQLKDQSKEQRRRAKRIQLVLDPMENITMGLFKTTLQLTETKIKVEIDEDMGSSHYEEPPIECSITEPDIVPSAHKKHIKQEKSGSSKAKKESAEMVLVKKKDKRSKEDKKKESSSPSHMCPTCGKTFLYLWNLDSHERVHTGDKPFKCRICDKRFTQLGHLSVHMRTHSGVKPYNCSFCQRSFSISHSLKKHLRIHTGEKPYSCQICTKSFRTSDHLSNHHKRHNGEKEFSCNWPGCERKFINVSEMKTHRARHDKPPAKRNPVLKYKPLSMISAEGAKLLAGEFEKLNVKS